MLTAAIGRLFAVAEAYPELRATENFQQLQAALTEVEGDIAVSRQVYNDTVLTYDTALESVPTSIIAGMFNFRPREYFEVEEAAIREAPQVELPLIRGRAALLLSFVAALALLVPGAAQAKSYSLPQAVVQVKLAPDGSLLVREDITFSYSGSFSGAYRDIPVRGGERVDLVRVSEGGQALQPGGNTVLGSFDLPGKYGVDANTQRVRVVWHYRALNEQRTYTIRYRFRGLAVAYDDVVDVNLQVWGDEWPVAVSDLRAEMELPRPIALHGSRYRVWGAPEWVRGVVDRDADGNVPAGRQRRLRPVRRDAHGVSPAAAHLDAQAHASSTATASRRIVAEQEERANEYAEGREKIDEAKDNLGRTLLTLAAFALLPALGIIFVIWLLFGRERGTGYDREYEQEPPSDESPAIVPPLLRQGTEPGSLEFTATLFDLVRRGYYVAKPVTTEKKTWAGLRTEQVADLELSPGDASIELTKFEEPVAKVFDHIVDDGPEVLSKMRDRIESTRGVEREALPEASRKQVSEVIGEREAGTSAPARRSSPSPSSRLVAAAVVLLWMGIAGFRPEAPRWNEIVQIALGVCAIVNAVVLVIGVANTKLWRRRTKAGQLEAQRWEAFRRYLADFPAARHRAAGDAAALGAVPRVRDRLRHRRARAPGRAAPHARGAGRGELDLLDQPARRPRLGRERARHRRPLVGLRLGAGAALLQRLRRHRRRLLGRWRRWRRRRRRRRLVDQPRRRCS